MTHGGKRGGAGRPKGSNAYGESTYPLRIPVSRIDEVKAYLTQNKSKYSVPLFSNTVRAGVPETVEDHIEQYIDLNAHLIKHPDNTFVVIASGDSMINAGINNNDMLVVDKSLNASHGSIVIASVANELTVKRLMLSNGRVQLKAENENYPPIDILDENTLIILGVVTHVIHQAN
jgi:DNA polymerase V